MKFVALLRGINVGGKKKVPMAELAICFQKQGFSSVKTILNTGNVVFEADQLPQVNAVQDAFESHFGFSSSIQIRSVESVASVIASYPFESDSESKHDYLVFTTSEVASQILDEVAEAEGPDLLEVGNEVLYWQVPKGDTLASPVSKLTQRASIKEQVTIRNVKTAQKIVAAGS